MKHALTYSIISHLRTQVPEVSGRVTWMYDGVKIDGTEKPFITVESVVTTNTSIAAGRRDFEEIYAWQIGVRAETIAQRERLTETVVTALRQRNIEFIDTRTNPPTESDQTFVADVVRIQPMPSDDISNETDRHRTYIDVEVALYRVNADGLRFTQ